MTVASELGDCGWCQSAGSVFRGRCRICDTVVVEKAGPLNVPRPATTGQDTTSDVTSAKRSKRPKRRPDWVA